MIPTDRREFVRTPPTPLITSSGVFVISSAIEEEKIFFSYVDLTSLRTFIFEK